LTGGIAHDFTRSATPPIQGVWLRRLRDIVDIRRIRVVSDASPQGVEMKQTVLHGLLAASVLTLGVALSPAAQAASSTFDSGTDGWSALGDVAGPLVWNAGGGNPGGNVSIVDSVTGGVTYFAAPAAFLGNQSAALGTNLTFDLMQSFTGGANQFLSPDVILGGNGLSLAYGLASYPANGSWTSYAVPLTAGDWHIGTLSGAAPTSQQFLGVLSNLGALQIRAEYQTGPDTDSLDNVFLAGAVPAVPEPQTYALLLAGLGLVSLTARRRRRG
jgi:hypothetical protein